jgi:hypothetical protein
MSSISKFDTAAPELTATKNKGASKLKSPLLTTDTAEPAPLLKRPRGRKDDTRAGDATFLTGAEAADTAALLRPPRASTTTGTGDTVAMVEVAASRKRKEIGFEPEAPAPTTAAALNRGGRKGAAVAVVTALPAPVPKVATSKAANPVAAAVAVVVSPAPANKKARKIKAAK